MSQDDSNTIYRARVDYEPVFRRVGRPEPVVEVNQVTRLEIRLHPDGDRILVLTDAAGNASDQNWLGTILNFDDFLREKAPVDE